MSEKTDDVVIVPKNFDELLVEQVKANPLIYNTTDKNFKSTDKKEEAWQAISLFLSVPLDYCAQRWRTIRERYVKKKKHIAENSEDVNRVVEQWSLFQGLDFLDPYISHRKRPIQCTVTRSLLNGEDRAEDSGSDAVSSPSTSTHTQGIVSDNTKLRIQDLANRRSFSIYNKRKSLKRLHAQNNQRDDLNLSLLKAVAAVKNQEEDDEEGHFGKIVAATLRRLSPRQRAQTKLVIYQILVDTEFPPQTASEESELQVIYTNSIKEEPDQ